MQRMEWVGGGGKCNAWGGWGEGWVGGLIGGWALAVCAQQAAGVAPISKGVARSSGEGAARQAWLSAGWI